MIRNLSRRLNGEDDFHWRAQEVTRLEGFSDAVFAFAVTLLVVSLEVPKTFPALMEAMRGFAAFGVCFALLANVWYHHCRFFRRYALQDPWSVFLNCALLFFVLFYVYPLKFLFVMLLRGTDTIAPDSARTLFVIFGFGYAALFLVFSLLYLHALRLKNLLELNPIELLNTRQTLIHHAAMVCVGLLSVGLALSLPSRLIGIAGYAYFINGPYFMIMEPVFGRQRRRLKEAEAPQESIR